MELGIFAKTFSRDTPEAVLDAVQDHGFSCAQWNMSCAGLPSMPDEIESALAWRIRRASEKRGIRLVAVSGTFNTIHPDPRQREAGLRRLKVLAEAAPALGIKTITLSTGTRDPEDTWRHHPDNATPRAWTDLVETMRKALVIAEETDVNLAIETEINNVVNTSLKAMCLLEEMHSPRLKVVLDASNLLYPGKLGDAQRVLEEALYLLGENIVMVHAKDLTVSGGVAAVGKGELDFELYLSLLQENGFDGPMVIHGLYEKEVPESRAFLHNVMAGIGVVG